MPSFEDEIDRVWELYHANSKNSKSSGLSNPYSSPKTGAMYSGFSFAENDSVVLPSPEQSLHCDLLEIMRVRRSAQPECRQELPLGTLSNLLYAAVGIISSEGGGRKSTPSAGGLYSIDLFGRARNCENIPDSIFYYVPQNHRLSLLRVSDKEYEETIFLQKEFVDTANLELFLCASFGRLTPKYGERGYRYCLLEAGHVAQNLTLAATALGLKSCCIGGYYDQAAESLIALDGVRQSVIYSCIVGF